MFIIAQKDSDSLKKIYDAKLRNLNLLNPNDSEKLYGHTYPYSLHRRETEKLCPFFDLTKYDAFYYELLLSNKEEKQNEILQLLNALGVDEHNLRYRLWFTNVSSQDSYFDGDGNLMETKPELPSLRILGRKSERPEIEQQKDAAAQTATTKQSQGIDFNIIVLILFVVGVILCIVGFITINVIMLAIGVPMAVLGYTIISSN